MCVGSFNRKVWATQAERAGVRMKARRAKTPARVGGLVHASLPLQRGTPKKSQGGSVQFQVGIKDPLKAGLKSYAPTLKAVLLDQCQSDPQNQTTSASHQG